MHSVIRNHANTFEFILDSLAPNEGEEVKGEEKIAILVKKDQVDTEGKSLLHYIVNPLPWGSYENA